MHTQREREREAVTINRYRFRKDRHIHTCYTLTLLSDAAASQMGLARIAFGSLSCGLL